MNSLRDSYIPPSSAWSFLPQNSTTATTPPSQQSVYQWSTRSKHNSIFDLSPSLDLTESSGIDATLLFRSAVASFVLGYTSTAIAMPWEVGKMLLQVQWVPRDARECEPISDIEEDVEVSSDSSNDNDSYFADPNNASPSRHHAVRLTDDQGYVIRRSVLDESTRPEYIIPVGSADGVWGMIKRIGGFRSEGWLALWKGLLTSCVNDALAASLQPLIHNLLQAIFLPTTAPFHQPPIHIPIASHIITGFLLSPLDLIRTRLIIQSFNPRHSTYTGPIDALFQILQHEGGLKGIYLHPHVLIPTLIDSTLRPLVSLALPGLFAAYFGTHITEDTNPVAWSFAELAGSCAGLLITLPFETVRRRLQVQVRGTAKPVKTCVEVRPAPYNGVVDTMWHILTEERSDLPVVRRRKRRLSKGGTKGKDKEEEQADVKEGGWCRNTGIGQLYRGLSMRLGASGIVFLLAVFSPVEGDGGWAEL